MSQTKNLPTLHISSEISLPDNDQWQFRFQIESESSDRLYTIAQNKKKKHWGCSCFAYRRYRKCKHLTDPDLNQHREVEATAISKKIIAAYTILTKK